MVDQNDEKGFRMRGTGVTSSNVIVSDGLLDYGDFISSGSKKAAVPQKTSHAPKPVASAPVVSSAKPVTPKPVVTKPAAVKSVAAKPVVPAPVQTALPKTTKPAEPKTVPPASDAQTVTFDPEKAEGAVFSQTAAVEFNPEESTFENTAAVKSGEKQNETKTSEHKSFESNSTEKKSEEKKDSKKKDKTKQKIKTDDVSLEMFQSKEEIKKAREQEKKQQKERRKQQKKELKAQKKKARENQVKVSIGGKLIAIISLLFIIALGGLTYLVSVFVSADVRNSAEENNLTTATRVASDTENRIASTVSSVGLFLDLLRISNTDETERHTVESLFFERNEDVVAVYLPASERLYTSQSFFLSHEIDSELVAPYFAQESDTIEKAANGTFGLENATPFFSIPTLAIFFPLTTTGEDNVVAIIYSSEAIAESFSSSSINQTFFVNDDGKVLLHSDAQLTAEGADERENPVVKAMFESSAGNTASQINFMQDGEEYLGAYKRLSIGNGGIVTTVKAAIILEGVTRTTKRNVYISIAILAIAILAVYFFAKTLSSPLKRLSRVVNEINQGNFNTELFGELGKGSHDEVGVLVKSTHLEREILNTFTKLTNKGVTKAIIKKEIDFEPHLKDITIFFSDIRGFTAISDGFKNRFGEKSAAEIIGFLNDYMSRMVTCISRTGGIVDKFEGDAIMACWGVLRNENLDWEKKDEASVSRALAKDHHDQYIKEDALSGITCCIAMRYSLMKYNKDAAEFTEAHKDEPLAQYKPHIRIGAGLNSGRATVGFMGSFEKMEFTSIGDAVNFASRTEASNKPCGTDILMTQDTYDILKYDYIRCEENGFTIKAENKKNEIIVEQIPVEFEVKGKGKQHFYGVVNMPGFDIQDFFGQDDPDFRIDMDCARTVGPIGPKNLSEVRALLGIPEPDFSTVNLDAEENKIQVAAP